MPSVPSRDIDIIKPKYDIKHLEFLTLHFLRSLPLQVLGTFSPVLFLSWHSHASRLSSLTSSSLELSVAVGLVVLLSCFRKPSQAFTVSPFYLHCPHSCRLPGVLPVLVTAEAVLRPPSRGCFPLRFLRLRPAAAWSRLYGRKSCQVRSRTSGHTAPRWPPSK